MCAKLIGGDGQTVLLGQKLGQGHEGTVFEIANRTDFVAKIYSTPLGEARSAKLAAMTGIYSDRLLSVAAWPVDMVRDRSNDAVVGLIMPRIRGHRQIHTLYGPKTRREEFPNATWQFLIHAATNLARAFAVVHDHGHVVGDVSHANALVLPQATVKLIDCDSFQVAVSGRTFPCEVGTPLYQPPEFQSLPSFRGLVRTPNHDNFGLAVLIFQLLMMGRHPFVGKHGGNGDVPPIHMAIKEHYFAYGSWAALLNVQPPPNTLSMMALSPPIVDLFERAFSPKGATDGSRPSAVEWITALDGLAKHLHQCKNNMAHTFFSSLAACPWCDLEKASGVLHFKLTGAVAPTVAGFDLSAQWGEIVAVQSPGPSPDLPHYRTLKVKPSSAAVRLGLKRRFRIAFGVVIVVGGIAGWSFGFPLRGGAGFWTFVVAAAVGWWVGSTRYEHRERARQTVDNARKRWVAIFSQWQAEAGDKAFREKLQELEKARETLLGLPERRKTTMNQLAGNLRERQLYWFLEQFRIKPGVIKGIAMGRLLVLNSYGIETAADVSYSALGAIPGFGPKRTQNIMDWRRDLERRFIFAPGKGIDQRDIDDLERELRDTKTKMERCLAFGAGELRRIAAETLFKRQSLRAEVDLSLAGLARSEAEWRVL